MSNKKAQAIRMMKVSFTYEAYKNLSKPGATIARNFVMSQYGYKWDTIAQTWLYSKTRDMNKALGYTFEIKESQ